MVHSEQMFEDKHQQTFEDIFTSSLHIITGGEQCLLASCHMNVVHKFQSRQSTAYITE